MKKKLDLPHVPDVQLVEIFGLRSGVLILIILIALLLLAIFLIGILPGILKGGRYVTINAPLSESGVFLDGTYLGSADHQYFVTSGEHEIALYKSGVHYATQSVHIDHPLFFTWLFRRTVEVNIDTIDLDPDARFSINRFNLNEIAAASAILNWDMQWRYPPLFDNLITDLFALNADSTTITESIELALHYISSTPLLEEARGALLRHGLEEPAILREAEALLTRSAVITTPPFSDTTLQHPRSSFLNAEDLHIEGTHYEGGQLIMGRAGVTSYEEILEAAVQTEVEPFTLANNPVTQYQWARFLEENPSWKREFTEQLQKEGLVDQYYLAGQSMSTTFANNRPVTNVSYHAAIAFCQWLSALSGKQIFLPTEAMTTLAMRTHSNLRFESTLSSARANLNEPAALLGGVWEMTQTPFIPLMRLGSYQEVIDLHSRYGLHIDPIVKGGSYLSDPAKITADSVGVVEAEACADNIGLRIAWYE